VVPPKPGVYLIVRGASGLIDAVRILATLCSDDLIAGTLNRNGLLTGDGNR
jgi:hypothetical protein